MNVVVTLLYTGFVILVEYGIVYGFLFSREVLMVNN